MPSFDIVRSSPIDKTFRVQKVANDYDLTVDEIAERFTGSIELPEEWQKGAIVGASGTGKTTIATQLFGDVMVHSGITALGGGGHKSVIDDMPKDCTFDQVSSAFYSVGFGSVPSWLKPYFVLSNGEKMRVDLAYAMLSSDLFCFDEFTSVVDRNVAKTLCQSLDKALKRNPGKQFVAVSCHKDILEYLQPDWVFDTDTMQPFFASARTPEGSSTYGGAGSGNGQSLGSIII